MQRCTKEIDVPYTNFKTGQQFWKKEVCGVKTIKGSSYCFWHSLAEEKRCQQAKRLEIAIQSTANNNNLPLP